MNKIWVGILSMGLSLVGVNCMSATPLPAEPGNGGFKLAIDSTDYYIARSSEFADLKRLEIDKVRKKLASVDDDDLAEAMLELGRNFRRYNVDSAAYYFDRAKQLAEQYGDETVRTAAMLELAAVNPLRGIIKESVDMFESVDSRLLTTEALQNYFDRGFDVYVTTATFYGDDAHGREYLDKALVYSDSLVKYLPHGSSHQLYHKGWSAMNRGDLSTALSEMKAALAQSSFGNELYARITASLADLYQFKMNDAERAAYYLALSSMSDIAAGTKETTSLQRLGLELYSRGDISRAHRYLSHALENSIESGSKIRTLNEINILPVVSKAYNDKDASRIRWLYVLVAVLTVAMIAFAVMVWVIYRSKMRLSAYRARLASASTHKDGYINQILAICSSYVERIEELNKLIVRKVKTGQSQDLCRMVESGEMMRDQSEKFLRSFDKAFLSFYPDFVEQLNGLMREDTCFIEPSDGKLTPELRIAAFMRLGVDDSARIARLLGLSLNTVYTYRNKLRNRAIDRENFEQNLQKIGEIAK
ncbi:MAG: hypothetical protein K2J10_02045 [Muribaculaceae bacterium]|nr:hypothetical protein [Muribaculaceae bacterium]